MDESRAAGQIVWPLPTAGLALPPTRQGEGVAVSTQSPSPGDRFRDPGELADFLTANSYWPRARHALRRWSASTQRGSEPRTWETHERLPETRRD
jgi:hypothetical protein